MILNIQVDTDSIIELHDAAEFLLDLALEKVGYRVKTRKN